jgi:hypothetical protein
MRKKVTMNLASRSEVTQGSLAACKASEALQTIDRVCRRARLGLAHDACGCRQLFRKHMQVNFAV